MRLMRSLLFAPANRQELLKKFPRYPADAVAIDLEDGTPENEKADARDRLPDIVAYLREQHLGAMLFVRTNGPRSHHMNKDVAVAVQASVDGIILPKLETTADLQMFEAAAPIIGIIETARGVANVEMLVNEQGARGPRCQARRSSGLRSGVHSHQR
jgi:citrate lyase subunit beta / citryl-CoA lyase